MATEIKNIWYNPANSAFEGRIDIRRNGKSFRYPCAVQGPMDMSPAEVRARMEVQAKRMSDSDHDIFSYL
ncbi:hypothetical protein ROLI_047640 (plasmid) [Roseobacter fucihabitans]|uniref:Orotidine 5'-phosphate decarboxylase n=1 Tax=Roseobacter fucihabitans TaxID=1537242 RepID=A0ABZ2C0G9_9RHOB|nr:orotidine 5'-phosphate decarboxylase [Roseobacter litoralis]MBC6967962.1 hypothetical protein [Roseobacter litoralis]